MTLVGVLAMLIAGGMIYYNALENPFHYDDLHSVLYNPHIRSLDNIPSFFTDPGTFSNRSSGYMFRPLLLLTYALNYAVDGQQVIGYRLANLLLHIGCAILVACVVNRRGDERWSGMIAGWFFLVHPAHAELINYISSRSDLLVAFFYLLTVWALMRGSRMGSHLAYAAGLLTKSVAITLPFLVGVFKASDVGVGKTVRNWRWELGLGGISIAYLIAIWMNRFVASSAGKVPRGFAVQLWTQMKALPYYLWLYGMPVNLTVEHQFPESAEIANPASILGGLLLLSLIFWIWQGRKTLIGQGGIWFLITLLPVTLIPLNILVSERRVYLASAGLLVAAAWSWTLFLRRRGRLAGTALFACCALFSFWTVQRNPVWRDDISLWEDAAGKAPLAERARMNLAMAYEREGRIEEAVGELNACLQLEPDYADAWVLLGNIFKQAGEIDRAEEAYRRALSKSPGQEGILHNLGNLYLQDRGEPEKAVEYFVRALAMNEKFVRARNNYGQALEMLGRREEAMEQYEMAVADSLYWDRPDDPELGGTWFNLGVIAEELGRRERAHQAYRRAYELLKREPRFRSYAQRAHDGWQKTGGDGP